MLERILGPLADRWPWVRVLLTMQQRYADVRGNYLAAAVALNMFISILPALVVAIAVVGYITNRDTSVADRIIENLGLTGATADYLQGALDTAADSRKAASIIGLALLAWSGLGVVAAIEYAFDATWQHTGRGIKDKLRGTAWGFGALVIIGSSIAVTTLADVVTNGIWLVLLSSLLALGLNFGFWMFTFMVLSYQKLPWKAYVPGAIMASAGLEILKLAAGLLGKSASNASDVWGPLAFPFAILAAMVIFAKLLVYASTLNVIRWEKGYGTVTVDIEVPKIPGEVPIDADRAGAVDPPSPA